jgi:hypothetical protein
MKKGQIVFSTVKMQPLEIDDRGVISEILNNGSPYPIMVKWDKLGYTLPMKEGEIR